MKKDTNDYFTVNEIKEVNDTFANYLGWKVTGKKPCYKIPKQFPFNSKLDERFDIRTEHLLRFTVDWNWFMFVLNEYIKREQNVTYCRLSNDLWLNCRNLYELIKNNNNEK